MIGFLRVLKVLWTLGDRLAPLFEQLPAQLPAAGRAMQNGGNVAIETSHLLKGGGSVPVSAKQMVNDIATVVSQCKTSLQAVTTQLQTAITTVQSIQIPTVTGKSERIMGHDVLVGLNFGSTSLFGNFGSQLNQAFAGFGPIRDSLGTAVTKLGNLRDALEQAGTDLDTLGSAMKEGGTALQI